MAELLQFMTGFEVRCPEGRVGHLRGLILDPRTNAITHLSVEASGLVGNGKLVPLPEVGSADSSIELRCTRKEFKELPDNEELLVAPGPGGGAVRHVHLVPHGEIVIREHDHIYASDGRAGTLIGLVVDRKSHSLLTLLVETGHFASRHQVSIPFEAVTDFDARGLHVGMSNDEVADLGSGLV